MASCVWRARIRRSYLLGLPALCGACTMTQTPPAPAAEPLAPAPVAESAAPAFEAGVELPAGLGREILVASCLDCHTLTALPLFKAFYTRDSWLTLVLTMKDHGADVGDAEIEVLADYLALHFGAPTP
jgi:mono/diheme cytochrome c family protein